MSGLSDAIAESKLPALDLAANYDEIGEYALKTINPRIEKLGLTLTSFVIENISLPEEVEKSMDKRTSMGVLGDMNKYAQYQAAEAMREAANNSGSMAGAGVGMGAGIAMGQMFSQAFQQQTSQAAPVSTVVPVSSASQASTGAVAKGGFCANCGQQLTSGAKFCPSCGQKQETSDVCPSCGQTVQSGARFCANCGKKL